MSRLGDSQMALTLTPLGVTAGSPWRQPWGWKSLSYPKPQRGDRFCVRKNGANRAAAPSGANGLGANISHGLRRGLPAAVAPRLKI